MQVSVVSVWPSKQLTLCFLAFMALTNQGIYFFLKGSEVYMRTGMLEWPHVIYLAALIWPVIRNTAKVLNISS